MNELTAITKNSLTAEVDEIPDPNIQCGSVQMDCERSGWLLKKGAIHKSWQKRYFVLCGSLMYYFPKSSVWSVVRAFRLLVAHAASSQGTSRAKGCIRVRGGLVMATNVPRHQHCFIVRDSHLNPPRDFVLEAPTEIDRDSWIAILTDKTLCASPRYESMHHVNGDDAGGEPWASFMPPPQFSALLAASTIMPDGFDRSAFEQAEQLNDDGSTPATEDTGSQIQPPVEPSTVAAGELAASSDTLDASPPAVAVEHE